jgi:diacylglycerol kinase family enzyme
VLVTDGDPLINTAAWALARFYRRELVGDDAAILEMARHLAGEPLTSRAIAAYARHGWQLLALTALRLGPFEYPDLVALFEIEPAAAMARIHARGKPLQTHETEEFLAQLGTAYDRVCGLLQAHCGVRVVRVQVGQLSAEEAMQHVIDAVADHTTRAAEPPAQLDSKTIFVVATTMSGSLKDQAKVELIEPEFRARAGTAVFVAKAHSHAEAREMTRRAVQAGARIIVSAGGGGTFNAVVEGCHIDGVVPPDLRLAFLRKGSADLIGKALGIPDALPDAVQTIVNGIEADHDMAADVLAVEAASPDGNPHCRHLVGFGGFGVFGEVPRFTEARWIKYYKGVLGALFGDLGPFFVGLPLATASWLFQRLLGRTPHTILTLDGEVLAPDLWGAVLLLNGDLGRDLPLARGLPLASSTFRVVALRFRGFRTALRQIQACRRGTLLDEPERFAAVVRTVRSLVVQPVSTQPFLVNVDGLRVDARGAVRVSVSGRVNLIAAPRSPL